MSTQRSQLVERPVKIIEQMRMCGDSAELEFRRHLQSGPREPTLTYRMIEEELGLAEPVPVVRNDPKTPEPVED